MQLKALNIEIFGRVQKVGCRMFLFEKAIELSLKGWVRNSEDGTVLVYAIGSNMQLDEFLEWCNKGSAMAKVKKVNVELATIEDFAEFKILK